MRTFHSPMGKTKDDRAPKTASGWVVFERMEMGLFPSEWTRGFQSCLSTRRMGKRWCSIKHHQNAQNTLALLSPIHPYYTLHKWVLGISWEADCTMTFNRYYTQIHLFLTRRRNGPWEFLKDAWIPAPGHATYRSPGYQRPKEST